ncbi:hypothetical protein HDU96_006117 [Phlyctochytrium bullatum]|nr:hypothetical protein HDU96_006117 [Phlyctochytrium bullatum]
MLRVEEWDLEEVEVGGAVAKTAQQTIEDLLNICDRSKEIDWNGCLIIQLWPDVQVRSQPFYQQGWVLDISLFQKLQKIGRIQYRQLRFQRTMSFYELSHGGIESMALSLRLLLQCCHATDDDKKKKTFTAGNQSESARKLKEAKRVLQFLEFSKEHKRLAELYWPVSGLSAEEKLRRTANVVGLALPRADAFEEASKIVEKASTI